MSNSGDTTTTIRYADYIESHHKTFLDTIATERATAYHNSPFATYTSISPETAFFGVGFALANFPSLYDMYGKFMAGLDIEALFSQLFQDTVTGSQVAAVVKAEAALMDDDLLKDTLPRFQVGMRDINSVVSSSFVVGKAMIEDARTKAVARFDAELRYRLIPVATERWSRHLEWNKAVVLTYAELTRLYLTTKIDYDEHSLNVATKNILWPFTVLEYERAALGALQGAVTSTSKPAGSDALSRGISGALGLASVMGSGGGVQGAATQASGAASLTGAVTSIFGLG